MNLQLPEFGKWMYESNRKPSLWRSKKLNGKTIWEPINIIYVDSISKSTDDSKKLLINSLKKTGFRIRWGHYTWRYGKVDEIFYKQLPDKFFHAFSNNPWWRKNNHCRFFGPHYKDDNYYYCGAISSETGVLHKYISFSIARDELSKLLESKAGFKIQGSIELDNFIENENRTTGDHDGKAVFITT